MQHEKIAIIGVGRLGMSLAIACREAGLDVGALYDIRTQAAKVCAGFLGETIVCKTISEIPGDITLIFLTIPDDHVAQAVEELRNAQVLRVESLVVHTSGNLSSSVLDPLKKYTHFLASLHPVQTFSGASEDWKRLFGITFSFDGHPESLPRLKELLKKLNGSLIEIEPQHKALYHLACALASNYLVGIEYMAIDILQNIGLNQDQAIKLLQPLVKATLENISQNGPVRALTGPISRGDVGTVCKHVQAMEMTHPEYLPIYRSLGKLLIELTRKKNSGSNRLDKIEMILNEIKV
jgi:predicted short-subunit dehydrogenase-like oxidoreductase (DUF2520 family)